MQYSVEYGLNPETRESDKRSLRKETSLKKFIKNVTSALRQHTWKQSKPKKHPILKGSLFHLFSIYSRRTEKNDRDLRM
jgi:hypothetical protein